MNLFKIQLNIKLFLLVIGILTRFSVPAQQSHIDSLKFRLDDAQDETKIELLLDISDKLANSDPAKSLEYASRALQEAKESNDEFYIAKSQQAKAYAYYKMGDLTQAIEANIEASELYEKTGNDTLFAEITNSTGALYTMQGNLVKARQHFEKALELNRRLGRNNHIPSQLMNIGVIYKKQGRYEKALTQFTLALEHFDQNRDSLSLGNAYANIGNVYAKMDDYDKAIKMFMKASGIFEAVDNTRAYAKTINNIGTTYMSMNNHDRAKAYFRKAMKLYQEMGATRALGNILFNLANVENQLGNFDQALEHGNQALEQYKHNGNKLGIIQVHILTGIIHLDQHELEKAEDAYFKAQEIMKEAGQEYLEEKSRLHLGLSYIHELRGNYKLALKEHRSYSDIKDSITRQLNSNKIAELQSKFEYSELEKENEKLKAENLAKNLALTKQQNDRNRLLIALLVVLLFAALVGTRYLSKRKTNRLLAEKNKQIRQQKEEVEKANAAKDKIFSIIAHDLKTPFNSIIGFAELLDDDYEAYTDDEKKEYIRNIRNSSEMMLDLLENLLVWSREQQGRMEWSPATFAISETIQYTVDLLDNQARNKNIEISTSGEEDTMVYADKSMVSTVMRNLLSNAIKFTNRKGRVDISYKTIDHKVEVAVTDNGVGMSKEMQVKLFDDTPDHKSSGTENEKGTGLGLMLVREFVEKNGGTIWVNSEKGKGSEFIFTLPRASL